MAKKNRRVVARGPGGRVYGKKNGIIQPLDRLDAEMAERADRADEVAERFIDCTDGRATWVGRNGVVREERPTLRTPMAVGAFAAGDTGNFLAAATPGGIERQEAEAQRRLVSTQKVPIKLGSPKEQFERLGFKFGKAVDRMLQEAELPKGWTKVPHPGHSMYSYVLDDKGRARWTIFFKGAFYDYEAFGWGLQHRYVVKTETDYDRKSRGGERPERGVVLDYGVKFDPKDREHGGNKPKVIHQSHDGWFTAKDVWDDERVRRMLTLEMELWIDARFPQYQDPLAYWD